MISKTRRQEIFDEEVANREENELREEIRKRFKTTDDDKISTTLKQNVVSDK